MPDADAPHLLTPPGSPGAPEPGRGVPARAGARSTAELFEMLALRLATERLRLRDVLALLGDRGMASVLLLLTLPQLVPMPLILSNVLALPVVLVAAQMAWGRRRPWLPRRLLDRPVTSRRLAKGCARLASLLRRVERVIRPRLWPPLYLTSGRLKSERLKSDEGIAGWSHTGRRLFGAGVLVIALVLLAPLPLTTWLPAWALTAISIGMLEHDGLVVGIGFALGAAAIAVMASTVLGIAHIGAAAGSLAGAG